MPWVLARSLLYEDGKKLIANQIELKSIKKENIMSTIQTIDPKNATEKTQMKINDVIHHYEKSLNASDTETILNLYGKDPIFMPQHAPAQVGRDQVRAAYEHVFDAIKLNIKFTVYEIEEFGDLAYVRTSSAGTTTIRENDAIVNEGNNELFVFRNEDGDWKIHRYIFSTSNPR